MKLMWHGVVDSVHEKEVCLSGKIIGGETKLVMQSQGWFIQFGNMSLYAGQIKPGFERGDMVLLTLEHCDVDKDGTVHTRRVKHTEVEDGGSPD